MGNFRIRKAEFLNQNSRWDGISTKIFFAPEAEIVFQQYLPKADIRLLRPISDELIYVNAVGRSLTWSVVAQEAD